LAGQYQVHPTQISQWKRQVQGGARALLSTPRAKGDQEHEAVQTKLYEEVGRLKMELDWIKKTAGLG
jgi:putative transposase